MQRAELELDAERQGQEQPGVERQEKVVVRLAQIVAQIVEQIVPVVAGQVSAVASDGQQELAAHSASGPSAAAVEPA